MKTRSYVLQCHFFYLIVEVLFLQSHISVKTEPLELLYVPPFSYIDQLMLILRQKKKRVPTLSVIF